MLAKEAHREGVEKTIGRPTENSVHVPQIQCLLSWYNLPLPDDASTHNFSSSTLHAHIFCIRYLLDFQDLFKHRYFLENHYELNCKKCYMSAV